MKKRTLAAAVLVQLALAAQADAPGPIPDEAAKGAPAAAVPVQPVAPRAGAAAGSTSATVAIDRRSDGRRVISSRGDSAQTVTVLEKAMPNLKQREAREWRELEGIRRERQAEQEAALIHATECYRQWGEATCVTRLK